MKKPRISFIVIVLAIILFCGGVLLIFKYAEKKALASKTQKIALENLKDSDNDGLKDWEEELFKTNPRNPDTDGDGYLDGEEVNSGHNPLIKAPGDELKFYPLPLGDKYNVTKKVLNDEMLDSMLASYLSQKGEYISEHPEIDSPETFSANTKDQTIQEMSKRALGESYSLLLDKAGDVASEIPEIFKIEIKDEDIQISENNSPEAIKQYLADVSLILSAKTFFLQEQSFRALEYAFKEGDFTQLDKLISDNDEKIEIAKTISVPSSWKEIHKKGLELTLLIRNIYISFRDFQNDPLKAYLALSEFEKFADRWNKLMKQAIDLAKTQNIELSL